MQEEERGQAQEVRIERTNAPFPQTSCRPPQDGLESITAGEIHVGIYGTGDRTGWRAIVKGRGEAHWCAEGTTAAELGDAMAAIMHGLTHGKSKGLPIGLPCAEKKA